MVNNYHGYHLDNNLDDTFVVPPVVFISQDHYLEVLLGKNSATVDIEQCSVVIVLCLWYMYYACELSCLCFCLFDVHSLRNHDLFGQSRLDPSILWNTKNKLEFVMFVCSLCNYSLLLWGARGGSNNSLFTFCTVWCVCVEVWDVYQVYASRFGIIDAGIIQSWRLNAPRLLWPAVGQSFRSFFLKIRILQFFMLLFSYTVSEFKVVGW